jgi:hypothetical protein
LIGQFLGAFGDNFLLAAILGPLTYALNSGRITETVINRDSAATEAAIAAAVDGYIGARRNIAASHDTLRRSDHE